MKENEYTPEPYYTPEEYKNMDQSHLIKTFNNLIESLSEQWSDNGRLKEDIKQDLVAELLRRQSLFEPSRNTYFGAYIKSHMITAARNSYQRNFSTIHVPYTTTVKFKKEQRLNPMHTEEIDDYTEVLYAHKPIILESQLFSTLKVMLKALNKCDYTLERKVKIKDYLRKYLETGKMDKTLNRLLKKILETTVLKHAYK